MLKRAVEAYLLAFVVGGVTFVAIFTVAQTTPDRAIIAAMLPLLLGALAGVLFLIRGDRG